MSTLGMSKELARLIYKLRFLNRRRCIRIEPDSSLRCVCAYEDSGAQTECAGYIINLSRCGLLITTREKKILPHKNVEIRVQLASQKEPLLLCGVIVRTYRRNQENWYFSGVRLRENEEGIGALIDFVTNPSKGPA